MLYVTLQKWIWVTPLYHDHYEFRTNIESFTFYQNRKIKSKSEVNVNRLAKLLGQASIVIILPRKMLGYKMNKLLKEAAFNQREKQLFTGNPLRFGTSLLVLIWQVCCMLYWPKKMPMAQSNC